MLFRSAGKAEAIQREETSSSGLDSKLTWSHEAILWRFEERKKVVRVRSHVLRSVGAHGRVRFFSVLQASTSQRCNEFEQRKITHVERELHGVDLVGNRAVETGSPQCQLSISIPLH